MAYTVIDPQQFTVDEMFREDDFVRLIDEFDWTQFTDKATLVRGCGDIIFPPWAFMTITARLFPYAKSIRYGNEHDNAVVFRRSRKD